MKISYGFVLIICEFVSIISGIAQECDINKCLLPNCRCSGMDIPGELKPENTPQFVMLTFDDAITISNIEYYRKAFKNKTNPDGCPVAATFYVTHEYTDYSLLHELYSNGHEIASHSISHTTDTTYWKEINSTQITAEFNGSREIISKFGNIPLNTIKGIRLPFLQMSGDKSFEMISNNNFLFDSSWPTQTYNSPGLWPYTLDYKSNQDCVIGPCPNESWPGVWVLPMITWRDNKNIPCAMVDTCVNIPSKTDELVEFMMKNFNQTYKTNRAPIGFYVHAAWFIANPIHFDAYIKFLDKIQKFKDVFLVGATDIIEWITNPIPVQNMTMNGWIKCRQPQNINCIKKSCKLKKGDEERYMTLCGECPKTYPWLFNPQGN